MHSTPKKCKLRDAKFAFIEKISQSKSNIHSTPKKCKLREVLINRENFSKKAQHALYTKKSASYAKFSFIEKISQKKRNMHSTPKKCKLC